mmetsp:Transcript_47834/g.113884  ORF Transcript_47834/g.113884 Transcript_47834/m.113884 type:complete len:202 (+) Transcript_47834:547-1152(+)
MRRGAPLLRRLRDGVCQRQGGGAGAAVFHGGCRGCQRRRRPRGDALLTRGLHVALRTGSERDRGPARHGRVYPLRPLCVALPISGHLGAGARPDGGDRAGAGLLALGLPPSLQPGWVLRGAVGWRGLCDGCGSRREHVPAGGEGVRGGEHRRPERSPPHPRRGEDGGADGPQGAREPPLLHLLHGDGQLLEGDARACQKPR